jgi:hypothetical protein
MAKFDEGCGAAVMDGRRAIGLVRRKSSREATATQTLLRILFPGGLTGKHSPLFSDDGPRRQR